MIDNSKRFRRILSFRGRATRLEYNVIKVTLILISSLTFGGVLTGCSDSLSDDERDIVEVNLAEIIYDGNIDKRAEAVDDYLYEAIQAYVDKVHDETQKDIDNYNAASSLFGGSFFDVNELFGSSATEQFAKRYNKYLDYVNDHRQEMYHIILSVAETVKDDPDVLNKFNVTDSIISLEDFASIDGIPSAISASLYEKYKNIGFEKSDEVTWGELVMGNIKTPDFSPVAILCAAIVRIDRLKYPTAEYAVYDKEYEGWEVGFDTGQALFVTFKKKGDVLEYEYDSSDYFEGYIDSKNNKLK